MPTAMTANVKDHGFSLVELMVAITISLVLLAGLIQIFLSSKRSYNIQDSIARMQENGRYAIELLNADLRLAGYIGGNADVSTVTGRQPQSNNCVGSADAAWGAMIEQSVFGINDAVANYSGCIADAGNNPQPGDEGEYLSGDILTIRYARPLLLTAGDNVNSGGYYLNSSPMDGEIKLLDNGENIDFATLTDTPITFNKLETNTYYSGFQQSDCSGNAINVPTLYRLALDTNGTPQRQELIRGVENLQVQYGVDSNNNGSSDQYHNANTVTNWSQVRSVRLWLLIRDECPSAGYQNTNTYIMGDSDLTADDNFRRHLYTSTVMLRNNEAI